MKNTAEKIYTNLKSQTVTLTSDELSKYSSEVQNSISQYLIYPKTKSLHSNAEYQTSPLLTSFKEVQEVFELTKTKTIKEPEVEVTTEIAIGSFRSQKLLLISTLTSFDNTLSLFII